MRDWYTLNIAEVLQALETDAEWGADKLSGVSSPLKTPSGSDQLHPLLDRSSRSASQMPPNAAAILIKKRRTQRSAA